MNIQSPKLLLLSCILFSIFFLINKIDYSLFTKILFTNKLVVFIGKISFSVYLWHQLVFAFTRYTLTDNFSLFASIKLVIITLLLSICTYYLIERPFRNNRKISNFNTHLFIISLFISSVMFSTYIMLNNGVLRDHEALEIYKSKNTYKKHVALNKSARVYDTDFKNTSALKILVVGNSHARDWINILIEYKKEKKSFEISYIESEAINEDIETKFNNRFMKADIIFFVSNKYVPKNNFSKTYLMKIKLVSTKNFETPGINHSILLSKSILNFDYCNSFASISNKNFKSYKKQMNDWGNNFIDLVEPVLEKKSYHKVRLFDDNCKLISHDGTHLTFAGVKFYSAKLSKKLDHIIFNNVSH